MAQEMQEQLCKTCGKTNPIYESECWNCHSPLEVGPVEPTVDDKPQPGEPSSQGQSQDPNQREESIQQPEQLVNPGRRLLQNITIRWNTFPVWTKIVIVAVIFCLVLSPILLSVFNLFGPNHPPVPPTPPTFTDGIGVFQAPNGDTIGISDGRYPFDIDRPDGTYKTTAANALQQGNAGTAFASWQTAIDQDPSDGEAHIYLESQPIPSSGNPYITIVVAVAMAGDQRFTSRDVLQGAYIAQHEYNQTHQIKVRLLIASSGSDPLYTATIAQQILQVAKADSHTIAVMGWTGSARTLNAEPTLVKAQTPLVMLSQNASSTLLTGPNVSPYFFHIVPPDTVQAEAGAVYASKILGAHNVVAFVDHSEAYSQDLESSFVSKFTAQGGKIIASEVFKVDQDQANDYQSLLDDALKYNPDLIYFAGQSPNISSFLPHLPTTGTFANLRVMTGDAGAGVISVTPTPAGFDRLLYTAFADPDAWSVAGSTRPPFIDEYSNAFSGNNSHTGNDYTRSNAYSIVSYDGLLTLLTGYQNALHGGKSPVKPNDLQDALTHITGSNAIQGVSGQIGFDTHHDPIQKPVFIVEIGPDRTPHIVQNGIQEGCYIKGCVQ